MNSFHQTKGSFLLSLIAASVLGSASPLSAQEPSPIPLIPVTEPPVAVPDLTVPPAGPSSTVLQETPATDGLQIPQDVPLTVPDIQPASAVAPAGTTQDPPAPLPQADTELPPINADEMVDEDRDELLRGPVHEAYAEQLNVDPVQGMVVSQKPPEPVEEVPPELKPDGRQVEWISGYWAWDEDQDDFIWISGIWREVPQGFRWLPGYWTEVDGGYQWVSGTWVSTKTEEITYLNDAPPETLEQGPVGDAPTAEHIWIPGTWMWNDTRYAWRPGYWSGGYTNWIWVPARYQWTPRGYYYCDGYWDYPVQRRGVLFAPSYFNRRFHNRRISRFTPRVVVASNLLTVHFWVRPRYRHYYFGDYYNVGFANRGLTPWHQFHRQRRCFDPLYAHYGRGRRSNDFYNQLNVQFNVFVNQPNRRPPVRFRDQDQWARDHRDDFRPNDFLGNRFQNVVENASRDRDGFQFVRLENQQREQVQQETRRLRELMDQRRDVERSLAQMERVRDNAGDRGPNGRGLDGERRDGDRMDLRERLKVGSGRDGDKVVGDNRDGNNRDGAKSDRDPENRGRDKDNALGGPADVSAGDDRPNAELKEGELADSDRKGRDRKENDRGGRGRDSDKPDNVTVDGSGSASGNEVVRDGKMNNGGDTGREVGRDANEPGTGRDGSAPDNSNGEVARGDATESDKTKGNGNDGDSNGPDVIGRGDGNERPDRPTIVNGDQPAGSSNDDGRKGRDRLKLDPPNADGTNADSKPNRDSIRDQIGNVDEKINERRERAEKAVRDSMDRGTPGSDSTPGTDGVPAIGGGTVDRPKLDLPNMDDLKNRARDVETRVRDNAPSLGTGTDNSATPGGDAVGARKSDRESRRDRLKLPAVETPSGTNQPKGDMGARNGNETPSNQTGNENNPSARGDGVGIRNSDRETARERLRLPPATRPGNAAGDKLNGGSAAGNPATGPSDSSVDNSSRSNRNTLDSIRNSRSRQGANNPDVTSNPAAGARGQNPASDVPVNRSRGIDRSQNRSNPAGNLIDSGATDTLPRGDTRSRANSGSRINSPPNDGNTSGEDRSSRMRLDSNPPGNAVKEPSREPTIRNIPPQRDRSPVGGMDSGPTPGRERASRREAPPQQDSPPAASGRVRGGEPRGNPGGIQGGDSGAAREPRNNPSIGSPRGGDAGGGRASNPGAGRGDPGAGAGGGAARGAGERRREGGGGAPGGGPGAGGGGGRRGREK